MDGWRFGDERVANPMQRGEQASKIKTLRAIPTADAGRNLLWRTGPLSWGCMKVLRALVRKPSFFRHGRIC